MTTEHLTRKQELLDNATIDRFAYESDEYPQCYHGEDHWFFLLRGEKLSGAEPRHARHALAKAIRGTA